MKIFFDTNVLVAAVATHGVCSEIFIHCLENHQIVTSELVLNELEKALKRKLKLPIKQANEVITYFHLHLEIVTTPAVFKKICRDPNDDKILAAAALTKADCLLTGDKDLLILKRFNNFHVVSPKNFWEFEVS